MTFPRPFRDHESPGRIPDSLIDAVLDGSVDDQTRREVSRALRHDPTRQRDLHETIEAIDALNAPIECPDLSAHVLQTLDRKHRFLPTRARRAMQRYRLGIGLAALLALGTVAIGQRAMPRLASISTPQTPVADVAQAFHADAGAAADGVVDRSARLVQATIPLFPTQAGRRTLDVGAPGIRYRFEVDRDALGGAHAGLDLTNYRMITIDGGRVLVLDDRAGNGWAPASTRRGGTASMINASLGWSQTSQSGSDTDTSERDTDPEEQRGWVAQELP